MITEYARRLRPYLAAAIAVLSIWTLVLAGVTFARPAGAPVAIPSLGGTEAALRAVIAAGGSLVEVRPYAIIAISDEPNFVARLYRSGALLVIPARKGGGCLGVWPSNALPSA